MHTEDACPEEFGRDEHGGVETLHPKMPELSELLARIRGVEFDINAKTAEVVSLPAHVPQVRIRQALRPHLSTLPAIGLRLDEALTSSGVRSAQAVRDALALRPDQKVVLIMFCRDDLLERLWDSAELLRQVAAAGYDLVVGPSYSLYKHRPRPSHLDSLKRSLLVFEALQMLDVPVIVRVGFAVPHDVERLARWITVNPIAQVAVDLMTYKWDDAWLEQASLLTRLDRLTGRYLRYVVNGPSTMRRLRFLYEATPEDRLTFTEATIAGPPPDASIEADGQLDEPRDGYETHFAARCARFEAMRAAAAEAASRSLALSESGATPGQSSGKKGGSRTMPRIAKGPRVQA